MFRDAVISGANNIANNRQAVDALNVFPVPDGDTGTNMSMTIGSAAREISRIEDNAEIGTVAEATASALLRGARGNSGVILSLIFRGLAKGLRGHKEASAVDLSVSLNFGVEAAYKAVMKPTEGTMLTVVRIASEHATKAVAECEDPVELWDVICSGASEALAITPELLPVLKKSGVVDAGGKGLLFIFEGMKSVFKDSAIIESKAGDTLAVPLKKTVVANADSDIKFGYCTEFIVNREKGNTLDPLRLRAYLESIGDCVVVVDDESIIKVHVHTNEPGNAIQCALKYGPLVNIKVDNMRHQHSNASWGTEAEEAKEEVPPVTPEKPFGFVAVASGEGIQSLFHEIGVDQIVKGGQTMNPSTDDILAAVESTPAEHVFILPNNKNIIMAAEQVIPLADRQVSVLNTRTIPEGLSAMLNFDENVTAEENHINMMKAAEKVHTGLVTFAARDSSLDEQSIKEGQILGLENGKITIVESDVIKAAFRVIRHMFKKGTNSFITILYGENVTSEQADSLKNMLTSKYGENIDITVVNGGQPIYYFIISVE